MHRRLSALISIVALADMTLAGCTAHRAHSDGGPPRGGSDGGPPRGGSDGGPPRGGSDGGPPDGGSDGGCGYHNLGTPLHVAEKLDLCLPPVVCTAETCPPTLGKCVGGRCQFAAGYDGLGTTPEAWVTYYCLLSSGGCHGITQIDFPEVTARAIAANLGHPVCDTSSSATGTCIGITASSPMVVGNSQVAVDPATGKVVSNWGLGLTEATGLCYQIAGPGGTAIVAVTDRCGGYCRCNGSGFQECGPCVNAPSMEPNCPCVGSAPPAYTQCCGTGCPTLQGNCDWCASNNHPHFDLDQGTFNWVCGAQAVNGSCRLSQVSYIACVTPKPWPPAGPSSCGARSFDCSGTPAGHEDLVPSSSCCCDYNLCPQRDGSCAAPPSACKSGSCACGSGLPDANHPGVPSTGCCCVFGATPQSDGTCL
jgi:hypothetical protein